MFTATPRNDYLFGEDFVDGLDSPSSQLTAEEIKKAAHVVNGGEVAMTQCPSCRGSGRFRTYSGRDGGACFKCKGGGKITGRQVAAAKGKATKLANQAAWGEEHKDAVRYIQRRAEKSTFYASFLAKLTDYGTLTENQMALVYRDMAKDAEFFAKRKAEREAAAPKVDMTAITALFDRAPVKLVKKPIFRTVDLTIKKAPMTGRNPGALYVTATDGGEYLGKVVDGTFHKAYEAPADTAQKLMAVAVDPTAEAIKYARKFGACCCCGKTLRNPVSVLAVVGPVCGPRWGLDHLRMEAAALLDAEKAEEILATRAGGQ